MTENAKVLCFDIESAGVNALKSDLGFVILFGYKWLHEKQAHVLMIERKDLKRFDDRKLLIAASRILVQADLLVGHFASIFDRRFIQGRLMLNGLPPIPATRIRDTCLIARSVANYSSNRLKHLAKILKLRHQKLENGWPNAWFEVMRGDIKALRKMAAYCKGDVLALEELYLKLRPYDNPHPRTIGDRSRCSICGGEVQYRGQVWAGEHRYRRFQCLVCGKWGRERNRLT